MSRARLRVLLASSILGIGVSNRSFPMRKQVDLGFLKNNHNKKKTEFSEEEKEKLSKLHGKEKKKYVKELKAKYE